MRAAVAIAVRDQLRAAIAAGGAGLSAQQCELAPFGGRPPAVAPETFAGVYTGSRQNRTPAAGLDETYGCVVVLTVRTGGVPFDRLGPELMEKFAVGFDALSDRIRSVLARDVLNGCVQARANALVFASGLGPANSIVSVTDNGGGTVLFATRAAHGLAGSETLTVSGTGGGLYDGAVTVAAAPSATTFTVATAYAGDSQGGVWRNVDAPPANGFAECLRFLGDDDPQPVGGAWFHARPNARECGVVQRLRFGGLRRVQSFWDEAAGGVVT